MSIKYRIVELSASGFRNDYILLTEIMDFFPEALKGGSSRDSEGEKAILHIGIEEPVEADIDKTKHFFRVRGPLTRSFFQSHDLKPKDKVVFEKVGHHEYHVYPVRAL